jgi:hypothetical protein
VLKVGTVVPPTNESIAAQPPHCGVEVIIVPLIGPGVVWPMDVGLMAPRESVMAGVVVAVATVPETPFAVTTETEVTVPEPPPPPELRPTIALGEAVRTRVMLVAVKVPDV